MAAPQPEVRVLDAAPNLGLLYAKAMLGEHAREG